MDYEEKYKQLHNLISDLYSFMSEYCKEKVEGYLPEFKESEDEKIRKDIITFLLSKNGFMTPDEDWHFHNRWLPWIEKQGEQKQEIIYPKFDFDDILAIECCMETAEKVTKDKELYEKLKSIHSRLHDAYHNENHESMDKAALEPKFKVGDILMRKGKDYTFKVDRIQGGYYHCDHNAGAFFPIEKQDNWELVEQKPTDKIETKFKVGD